jgi:hypothetical protein
MCETKLHSSFKIFAVLSDGNQVILREVKIQKTKFWKFFPNGI